MTVSLRVMSAGKGVRYLLSSVATDDTQRDPATALTRYYAADGMPPGFWLGSGLATLANGGPAAGDPVTEEQLRRLIGHGQDPRTGEPLGGPHRAYRTATQRADARIATLPAALPPDVRDERIAQIRADEAAGGRTAVAGFDLTASVPKSVSVLWGLADAGTQLLIGQAHHDAVDDILDLVERRVAMTRVGTNGVAQMEVAGVIAAAFDHVDSRTGDPQLHTHVVIANRARTLLDGRWRTLDSRALHAAVVALSEHYNAVLIDRLARVLGVAWDQRERGRDRNPEWEITGVGEDLVAAFSSRTRAIDDETARLVERYRADHGRSPSRLQVIRLRQQATLATRQPKQLHSLADLTATWRARATALLGRDATTWAQQVVRSSVPEPLLRADDVPPEHVADLATSVIDAVSEKRSTWRQWNLHAEAVRQTKHLRFASPADREALTALVVDAAERGSLRLTPPQLASTPEPFLRPDGTSAFRHRATTLYSSADVLAAEDRLLALAATTDGPRLPTDGLRRALARPLRSGLVLADDQVDAIEQVVASGRIVDVLVGPAGSGKTTALGAMRRAWERRFGRGSVVGLAPSAAAADVLAGDLGIRTENTAKWLHEHAAGRWRLHPHQLVVVDEASLAGTLALDRLAAHAAEVGAKLLLVGDWAQLAAVDASGAFGLLVRDRPAPPELTDIRRFAADWEKTASLALRVGDPDALAAYQRHDRIVESGHDDVIDAAYTAWRADRAAGLRTLLIAHTVELTAALNERARLDLILDGAVSPGGVDLHDGNQASTGDLVVTRDNARRLRTGNGWVKNGDRWTVTAHHDDGSLTVRRADGRRRGRVTLPAEYVKAHVELAYASTAYRAQGATVDTAHAVVTGRGMTREPLYVAMTRGRTSNTVYVATDQPDLEEHQQPATEPDAIAILTAILARPGAELSARETIATEQDRYTSIRQLAAEYDLLAREGQSRRWTDLIEAAVPAALVDTVLGSDAFGALSSALRRAEANGHDVDRLLPRLVAARRLDDVDDPAKVLHFRVAQATTRPAAGRQRGAAGLIVGLVPEARGAMPEPVRAALGERAELMRARARSLVDTALASRAPWIAALGAPPTDARLRELWLQEAGTVAALRDRYALTAEREPLGRRAVDAHDPTESLDRQRAADALRRARRLSGMPEAAQDGDLPAPAPRLGPVLGV